MWVIIALFYINADSTADHVKVYNGHVFETQQQCFDSMMHNRNNLVNNLSAMEISSKYSAKCVDAQKYPQVMSTLNIQRS